MSSERQMRRNVCRWLRGAGLDAVAVENLAHPGTPDINYIEGALELKHLDEWPKRPETIVDVPHFTKQQRIWLCRRWASGGNAFFLLLAGKDWLLLRGDIASLYVGTSTRAELLAQASHHWTSNLDVRRNLHLCLSRSTQKA